MDPGHGSSAEDPLEISKFRFRGNLGSPASDEKWGCGC